MEEEKIEITYDMLADKSKRFVNNLADRIICMVMALGLGFTGNWLYDTYGFDLLAVGDITVNVSKFNVLYIILSIVFFGMFESLTARTPGKYITDTKVVMRDGTRPDSITIFIRTLCRFIPFEELSFIGSFTIGWHDMLSKTLVVDVYKYNKALQLKNTAATKQEF